MAKMSHTCFEKVAVTLRPEHAKVIDAMVDVLTKLQQSKSEIRRALASVSAQYKDNAIRLEFITHDGMGATAEECAATLATEMLQMSGLPECSVERCAFPDRVYAAGERAA